MGETKLNDDLFGQTAGWIEFYRDDRFTQRYMVEGELIFSETLMQVRGSAEAALAMLQDSWTWWDKGKLLRYQRNPDGSWELELKPFFWGPAIIRHHFFPPAALTDRKGTRLLATLSHHFEGPATWDVCSESGRAGVIAIRGRLHGIKQKLPIPFATTRMAARLHLGAESGTLRFPFPKGTGWVGLYRRLESQ